MQKIGVFVCWCGSNIAGTVDVDVYKRQAAAYAELYGAAL